MARKTDMLSSLIDVKYFGWIREAILKHGSVNIQALSEKFNILAGNTYFRNFIKDKNQDYLGISGLDSIVTTCGYRMMIVPVNVADKQMIIDMEEQTRAAFDDIRDQVSDIASTVKRPPKPEKKKKKTIANTNLINEAIMGIHIPGDADDDDDLVVGIGFDELDELDI